ncbi:MAG: type II toxin-antitoxin system PemK/MazF family toxin [Roseiarcus sp.]
MKRSEPRHRSGTLDQEPHKIRLWDGAAYRGGEGERQARARCADCFLACPERRLWSFNATDSITICAFISDETEAPLIRPPVDPGPRNGLGVTCRMMADKITTVSKSKLGVRVGRLSDEDILRLNRSLAVFLGLASSSRTSRQSRAAPRARSSRG